MPICFSRKRARRRLPIDPSYNTEAIVRYLEEEQMELEAILLTHGHFDHIAGIDILREATVRPSIYTRRMQTCRRTAKKI